VRLQRVLADAGIAARRACEAMIEEGRVAVNGRRVRRLPAFVDPERDTITVDGRPLPPRPRPIYIMVHKPERVLGSTADQPGGDRRSILDLVHHPAAPRLFPVGRLDYEARGLVLLTNDGELANRLMHPRFGVPKTYEVVVRGQFGPREHAQVERELVRQARRAVRRRTVKHPLSSRPAGTAPDNGPLPSLHEGSGRAAIEVLKREPTRTFLRITLTEGRNRRLPEMLRAAGCAPRRITRVAIGPLELRGLAVGEWRQLTRAELRALRLAARAEPAAAEAPRPSTPGSHRPQGDPPPGPTPPPTPPNVRSNRPRRTQGQPRRPGLPPAGLIIRRRPLEPPSYEPDEPDDSPPTPPDRPIKGRRGSRR
jgi:pseudouridine synthase